MAGPGSYRPLLRELRNAASPSWWVQPPGGPRKLWGVLTMLLHNAWLRAREACARRLGRQPQVVCPICGFAGQAFLTGLRSNWRLRYGRECPQCHSRERHRFLWLLLRDRYKIEDWLGFLVHFAPRAGERRAILAGTRAWYLSADLDPTGMDVCLDVTSLPFRSGSVSYVICSHVLEHVTDDRAALAELRRVLAPDGSAFISAPLFGESTREYGRADGQDHEHVRRYGRDLQYLLEQYFGVTVHEVSTEYDAQTVQRYRLMPGEVIYCCRP